MRTVQVKPGPYRGTKVQIVTWLCDAGCCGRAVQVTSAFGAFGALLPEQGWLYFQRRGELGCLHYCPEHAAMLLDLLREHSLIAPGNRDAEALTAALNAWIGTHRGT